MEPTPDRHGPTVGEPAVVPVSDALKHAVAAVTGHAGTVVGAVKVAKDTDADEPDLIVIDIYVDKHGHTHVEISEMWPPGYHVGMVVADVVVN